MAYTVTVVGSYPRPPREGGEFRLRKTLQALDRGCVSCHFSPLLTSGLLLQMPAS